jgi:hypothetical protein
VQNSFIRTTKKSAKIQNGAKMSLKKNTNPNCISLAGSSFEGESSKTSLVAPFRGRNGAKAFARTLQPQPFGCSRGVRPCLAGKES